MKSINDLLAALTRFIPDPPLPKLGAVEHYHPEIGVHTLVELEGPLNLGPWTVWLLDHIPVTHRMLRRIDQMVGHIDHENRAALIKGGADISPTAYIGRVKAGQPGWSTYSL